MSGISEMQLLYILKNHYSRICVSYNSNDIKEVMAKCRIPYFAAKIVKSQSRKVRPSAAYAGLADIFRAEYSLKSARFRPDMVIETLIMRLFLTVSGNKQARRMYKS
jgi:DNA polymerase III delta subunit